jgi:hypothetical protein
MKLRNFGVSRTGTSVWRCGECRFDSSASNGPQGPLARGAFRRATHAHLTLRGGGEMVSFLGSLTRNTATPENQNPEQCTTAASQVSFDS